MNTQIIESFIEEYNQYRQEFSKKAQAKLKEVLSEFWNENPAVNVIVWTQYAPYFTDGDACVFSVNDLTYSNCIDSEQYDSLKWGEYDGDDETVWALSSWNIDRGGKNVSGINPESMKDLTKFIQSDAMEAVLRDTLGEDNLIIVTRDGIISKDFSSQHD